MVEGACEDPHGSGYRIGVVRIRSGHGVEHEGAVGGGAGHGADVVEVADQRADSGAADQAVGGLESGDAGHVRRDTNRPAGVGAERSKRHARGDCGSGTSGRSAGMPGQVPGVAGRSKVGVVGGYAAGEFVGVGLAQNHRTGVAQLLNHVRVGGGSMVAELDGPVGRCHPGGVDDVLDGDGDAVHWAAALAGLGPGVGGPRVVASGVGHDRGVGVERGIRLLDASQDGVGQRQRRQFAAGERRCGLTDLQVAQLLHLGHNGHAPRFQRTAAYGISRLPLFSEERTSARMSPPKPADPNPHV